METSEELKIIEESITGELNRHWQTWRSPLRLHKISSVYNRSLKKLGMRSIDFMHKLDQKGSLIYVTSPLGKRYLYSTDALESMTREEILEEIRDIDHQESLKGLKK